MFVIYSALCFEICTAAVQVAIIISRLRTINVDLKLGE